MPLVTLQDIHISFGPKVVFDGLEPALVLRFIRYGLTGLWGSLGAPWVFVKLGLAPSEATAGG